MKLRALAAILLLAAVTVWRIRMVGGDFLPSTQIAVLSVVALLAGTIAFRIGGWTAAFVAALFVLGSRGLLVAATEPDARIAALLLHTIALVCLIHKEPNERMQRTAGVALGVTTIVRPSALVLATLLGVWMWRRDRQPPKGFGLGAALAVIPILFINLIATGRLVNTASGPAFYEGMNAYATGYAGVPPAIVSDLVATSDQPYRLVAARALGRDVSPATSNRYWMGKALAYVFHAPAQAVKLAARKLLLAAKSYEAYDRAAMVRVDHHLARRAPWIPFSLLLTLAISGVWLVRDANVAIPLSIYAAVTLGMLMIFSVIAPERALMVPSLAVLAGISIARLAEHVREGQLAGAIGTLILVTVFTIALHRDGDAQKEDRYRWLAAAESERLMEEARKNPSRAERLQAMASTWTTTSEGEGSRAILREAALEGARRTRSPLRRFDFALALARAGDWSEADTILESLQKSGYQPMRQNRTTNSVAYHRARALRRIGRAMEAAQQLARAAEEQPADVDILAAKAFDGDPEATLALDRLYDPSTRDLALARCALDRGNRTEAQTLARQLVEKMREWPRARKFATLVGSF